ncbi:MAG: DUF4870 domain-containing protein [Oceanipulchritudo sp.]|jgi:uncharacterized Tic20 family protein
MNEPATDPKPQPINASSDKLWNVLCHLSPFLGVGLILPLIVYLVTKSDTGSTIPEHAKETLNFHISLLIYGLIGGVLVLILIGFLILFAVAIGGVVLAIIGAVKASEGVVYRYPLTIRLVK